MRIYIGNLPFSTGEDELRTMFEAHGAVTDASVVTDRRTGRSRGFAFVEMEDEAAAQAALQALRDLVVDGRRLVVDPARPRVERRRGSRGRGRGRDGVEAASGAT